MEKNIQVQIIKHHSVDIDDYIEKNIKGMIDDIFFLSRSDVVKFILRRYFKNKEMKERRKRKISFIY